MMFFLELGQSYSVPLKLFTFVNQELLLPGLSLSLWCLIVLYSR